jgi:hypothetical protein
MIGSLQWQTAIETIHPISGEAPPLLVDEERPPT